jgi:DNA-directed RNA polymerase subunit RPC12/RpoP
MAEEYTCSSCGTKTEAEDTEDLLGKGWHIMKTADGDERILCPACFRGGRTLLPGEAGSQSAA